MTLISAVSRIAKRNDSVILLTVTLRAGFPIGSDGSPSSLFLPPKPNELINDE